MLALEVLHAGEFHLGQLDGLGDAAAGARAEPPPGHAVDLRLGLQHAEALGVLHHALAAVLAVPQPQAVDEVAALRLAALLGRPVRRRLLPVRRSRRRADGQDRERRDEL